MCKKMKGYTNLIIVLLAIVAVIAALVFGLSKDAEPQEAVGIEETQMDEEQFNENGQADEGNEEGASQAYNDMLAEVNSLVNDDRYEEALDVLDDYGELEDFRGWRYRYVAHSFLGNKEEARDALEVVLYDYGVLQASLWREYAILTAQTGGSVNDVYHVYEYAIPVFEAAQIRGVIDLYTAYATYLAAYEQYDLAIAYYQTALEANSARAEIYQTEIERLQGLADSQQ
jgi:tetratricopeptide (TPR) repeat protein